MLISDDRISALAKKISTALLHERLIETGTSQQLAGVVQKAMIRYVVADVAVDEKVRAKIASLKRQVPEGSREWDVLYQQYYEQELERLGGG
ncbi:MAG: DUF507 family protein [Deltaproteobacteria bacterium]|nr:DUF507 family protein [Deltaproteobacteria bacterium]